MATTKCCTYRRYRQKSGGDVPIVYYTRYIPRLTKQGLLREEKCNSPKIHIREIMGLAGIFRKNKMKKPVRQKCQPVSANRWEKQDSILLRQLRRLNGA